MDVLVSLGTSAAYIYSLLAILVQRMQARRGEGCHAMPVRPLACPPAHSPVCVPAPRCARTLGLAGPWRRPWEAKRPLSCLPACLQPGGSPSPGGGGGMAMGSDFFETAAMLITLVLFGKYLESAVSGGSGRGGGGQRGTPGCAA